MMVKAVKDLWVKALRSGDYEQGRNTLRSGDDKFCCYGVLCELAVQAGIIDPPSLTDTELGQYYIYNDVYRDFPPPVVRRWAGLNREDVIIYASREEYKTLAFLNDGGYSFETIADLIEEQL